MQTEILPVGTIQKSNSYKDIQRYSMENLNNAKEFHRTLPGTKHIEGIPYGRGAGINSPNEKMMNEAGVDALMTVNLNFELEQDGDYGVLVPKLSIEIMGKANGRETETKYFSGTISGKGIRSKKIGLKEHYFSATDADMKGRNGTKVHEVVGVFTPEELDDIVRRSDLLTVFTKALKELNAKEKLNSDYETVWNLQK